MRNLVRHRDNFIRSASREVLHLQKAMEQMNLKLDNVFSDILGKSGLSVIKAILNGERDPKVLSDLADPRCRTSKEEIEKSLQATWDEEHLFEMRQSDSLYQLYQQLIAECDAKINEIAMQYSATIDAPKTELLRSGKYNAKKNRIGFDVEKVAFELWRVNVMRIPGMSRGALLRLVGELGADFTAKFVDVKHFVSWANLVPNNKISGGALLSSKVPKKKNPVGIIFRQAANTLKAAKILWEIISDICVQKAVIYRLWWRPERNWHRYSIVWYSARLSIMKKFIVIIENKNYRTKSHTSINAYNVWNRNWKIVDKQMIFELCYIEAI